MRANNAIYLLDLSNNVKHIINTQKHIINYNLSEDLLRWGV